MEFIKSNDRGMMKWQGMMLAEHLMKIKEWENEGSQRPYLDEFDLTLIAEEIERAYKGKSTIKLTYWRDGQLSDDYGVPIEINMPSKSIVIDDPFGSTRYQFEEIVAVVLVSE